MTDQFTDKVNATNQQMWFNQASKDRCRLCFTLGIIPSGEIKMLLAQQMPPEEIVKMLRACADALESQTTNRIILPG